MTEGTLAKCTAIVDVIKKSGKTPIKADDIAAEAGMGLSGWNVSHMIRNYVIPELAPNIKKAPKLGYFWGEEEKMETTPQSELVEEKPVTLSTKPIEDPYDHEKFLSGYVYALDSFYHGDLVLLLGWSKSHISGLKLELINGENSKYDPQMHIKLDVIGVEKPEYYVDPAYIWCYSRNRIKKRKLWIDENQFEKEIKPAVAKALGLDISPKTIVKEKIVEKTTDDSKLRYELSNIRQQLAIAEETGKIWKQALYAVTGYKEG